jgi:DNA-binding CsgD family transcriptional regulator
VEILRNIGAIRMRLREVQEARFVFDQALRMAEDIGDLRLQYQIHGALSDVYEQLGHHAQALEHHKRYAEMREEIAGEEKQKAIAELQIRFDVEKAEREREIYRLKAEQLENDMQHKQNELTAMALNLAQKNELLESLKAQIKRLQKKHKDGGEEIVEHIIKDIDASKSADDDWKLFEQQLEAVHPDFIRRLSDRYSALTPTELKICSLIKTNLSAKDIANFLYISVRTAEVHRLNIRKKLKLGRGISLATFLASI